LGSISGSLSVFTRQPCYALFRTHCKIETAAHYSAGQCCILAAQGAARMTRTTRTTRTTTRDAGRAGSRPRSRRADAFILQPRFLRARYYLRFPDLRDSEASTLRTSDWEIPNNNGRIARAAAARGTKCPVDIRPGQCGASNLPGGNHTYPCEKVVGTLA
jgi:hypothetical protein